MESDTSHKFPITVDTRTVSRFQDFEAEYVRLNQEIKEREREETLRPAYASIAEIRARLDEMGHQFEVSLKHLEDLLSAAHRRIGELELRQIPEIRPWKPEDGTGQPFPWTIGDPHVGATCVAAAR